MPEHVAPDPIQHFKEWHDALPFAKDDMERIAMVLATASKAGVPSARIVLLKSYDERGFVFFTNMESHKSRDLIENPHASLCFSWIKQSRQVRVSGRVERVSDAEADAYYATRPLGSQIGAWASDQSRPLPSRQTLLQKVEELQGRYSEANPPPRPPHWSGWRVLPSEIEFWQEASYRLHDRDLYTRSPEGWSVQKLYP